MKTTIEVTMKGANEAVIYFPEFKCVCLLHSGGHINSIGNWSRYLAHGNTKRTITKEMSGDIYFAKMINMPDSAPDKYRLEFSNNYGSRGYMCTSEMNITKDMFEELLKNGKRQHSKANREYYILER